MQQNLLGKFLRAPLSLIPREAEMRILRGPLRGKKWVAGAASHGCWLGMYETERLRAFGESIRSGATVFDVGANVGIYALLASSRAGSSGRVHAFEPLERNLQYLRRHMAANHAQNCTIVEAAVSNVNGTRRFSVAPWDPRMARLSAEGEMAVPCVTLDSYVYQEKLCRPDVMKIDVEGAELEVFEGGMRTFREFHPKVFVEVHGTELHKDCCEFLRARGYQVTEDCGWLEAS